MTANQIFKDDHRESFNESEGVGRSARRCHGFTGETTMTRPPATLKTAFLDPTYLKLCLSTFSFRITVYYQYVPCAFQVTFFDWSLS